MSENLKSNNEYRDDGGWADAMDSGDPGQVEEAMSDVHETREGLENLAKQPFDVAPLEPSSDEEVAPLSQKGEETVHDEGFEAEAVGRIPKYEFTDEEEDILARQPDTVREAAYSVANATTAEDLEEDSDVIQAHVNQIDDTELAQKLDNRLVEILNNY